MAKHSINEYTTEMYNMWLNGECIRRFGPSSIPISDRDRECLAVPAPPHGWRRDTKNGSIKVKSKKLKIVRRDSLPLPDLPSAEPPTELEMLASAMACYVQDTIDGFGQGLRFSFKQTKKYFLSCLKKAQKAK